jgi:hypothetical protein
MAIGYWKDQDKKKNNQESQWLFLFSFWKENQASIITGQVVYEGLE